MYTSDSLHQIYQVQSLPSHVSSSPASSQFMEELLVKLLIAFFTSHGEENVSTDELVDDLTIRGQTLKDDILIILKLYHHMSGLPVNIPSLHGGVSPGLDMVSICETHPHDLVITYPQ